jgi:hypothetical protein
LATLLIDRNDFGGNASHRCTFCFQLVRRPTGCHESKRSGIGLFPEPGSRGVQEFRSYRMDRAHAATLSIPSIVCGKNQVRQVGIPRARLNRERASHSVTPELLLQPHLTRAIASPSCPLMPTC